MFRTSLSILAAGANRRGRRKTIGPQVSARVGVAIALILMGLIGLAAGGCSTEPAGSQLFDDSTVHDISVSFVVEDYEEMIETFKTKGQKDWIEATVTIDGETYDRVGMRLKGNSSIQGLRGGFREAGPGAEVTSDAPQDLPWLIRLDKFVEGQAHDGIVDLVVRSNVSDTSLNEAVALELLDRAGLASQDSIATRFTVNDSQPALRLVTELPDDVWMQQNLSADGALYKAESGGDYSYRGTDPDAYEEIFDQEAGKDNADLQPLMDFLDFINNADDATFNTELIKRIDVDSFATYLAMEELLDNFDDINGPGNNSYLFYDTTAHMFTVVPWDHNLAFGLLGEGAGEGPPGGAPGTVEPRPGTVEPLPGAGGAQRGEAARPGVAQPGAPGQAPGADGQAERGPGRQQDNVLVDRFLANDEWNELYESRLTELRQTLYESGVAQEILDGWVDLLETQASDLVSAQTVRAEADFIASHWE